MALLLPAFGFLCGLGLASISAAASLKALLASGLAQGQLVWLGAKRDQVLARLERDHLGGETTLTRHEFAHLLADAGRGFGARVAAGNGSLMVARLGELSHVRFRLVALLGVTDDAVPGRGGSVADAVDLGAAAPDERALRQAQLGHAFGEANLVRLGVH
mgnify:CR=1 FL=1